MSQALMFLLLLLASYRLTRLLVWDTLPFVASARRRVHDAVVRRFGDPWGEGIECPWCVGVYVSTGVVLVANLWLPIRVPGLYVLAVAAGVGLIAENLDHP